MFCKNCGKEIQDNSYSCPFCNTIQNSTPIPAQQPKSDKTGLIVVVAILGIALIFLAVAVNYYNRQKADIRRRAAQAEREYEEARDARKSIRGVVEKIDDAT